VSQKWRTNGALRCRRDYRKRQKNVKKILLDLFADLYEIVMTATSNRTYYHEVQGHSLKSVFDIVANKS
jgi:hypothetical protein